MYRIYDPELFIRGEKRLLWAGMLGRPREPDLAHFLSRYSELAPKLHRFASIIRFHLAPTAIDRRLRLRIEAGLADHFRACAAPIVTLLDDDIRFARSLPGEALETVRFTSDMPICGLPEQLQLGIGSQ
jgi:hypothetical protein